MSDIGANTTSTNSTGNEPDVGSNLKDANRTIGNVDQAFQVAESLVNDWKKGILNSARITSKLNGERPYNQKKLEQAGKGWKTNISTGFLATECNRILPRLYMPVKTAKYLTAAHLPIDYPNGEVKTQFFRQTITETIRSWNKWNFYVKALSREVGIFGFGSNVFFDEYDWKPTLMRMDRGFVPQGTEVMETEPMFFLAKYDYKPNELLDLLKASVDAGRDEWKKDNCVMAINGAVTPPVDATYPQARQYQDLIREATWSYTYAKGAKMIRTWHLFAKETTGKVSHYVLLADSSGAIPSSQNGPSNPNQKLLFEYLDQFDSMEDVANVTVFDYGDGTVHGSWGAGQILYDLAAQVEKVRCDSIDNMRMTNKMKLQVPDAKNVNDVKLTVNDTMIIVSGAAFAGNQAGLTQDITGYEELDMKLTQIAQQKIGAFIPPIPSQPSDIKAAQINAAMAQEKESQEALLENWLIQIAVLIKNITKRLCNSSSPDKIAKETRKLLLTKLTEEEIDQLAVQFPVQSVIDFTEFRSQQRAAWAATVVNNPLFRQAQVARVMAEGVGDERFVSAITIPDGDQSDIMMAQRDQLVENASIALGQPTPVVKSDNDWVHMQTMKPGIQTALQGGKVDIAQVAIQHYAAHYAQGVAKKVIPDDQINPEKSYIAAVEKQIEAIQQQQQIAQQHQQAGLTPPSQLPPEQQDQSQAVPPAQ